MNTQEFIQAHGLTFKASRVDTRPGAEDWQPTASHYRVTFRNRDRRQYTTYFSQGPAITTEPQAHEVLDCLALDASCAQERFEDFCSEFGCDTDSRKAERTWKACRRVNAALARLLGEAGADALRGVDRE